MDFWVVTLSVHRIHISSTHYLAVVDVSPPIACHGGTQGSLFGLQRMQNSTVNARDSRFILVRTLDRDRVIALRPVGVSLCVGLIVKCRVVVLSIPDPRSPALLYIVQEARVLVNLQCRVLVGLQGNTTTRIIWEES